MVIGPNPTRTLVTSAFRRGQADRDYVPDCDLLNPTPRTIARRWDMCGALSDRNFGSVRAARRMTLS